MIANEMDMKMIADSSEKPETTEAVKITEAAEKSETTEAAEDSSEKTETIEAAETTGTAEKPEIEETTEETQERCVRVSVSTSVGFVREHNEDNFYADEFGMRLDEEDAFTGVLDLGCRRIFAVCDGMGGEDFGDEASEISAGVIEFFKGLLREAAPDELHAVVNEYAIKANNEIWEMVHRREGYQSGSTMAMAIIDDDCVNIFNIGDSRVYFYKDKKLRQITEDQTLAMKKLKENIYTEEQAKNSPDCHRITNFLGIDELGFGPQAVHTGTFASETMTILICSDGLTDMCCDEEIAEILSEKIENHADALVDRALINGGVDNVTCVVISI